ncbi:hypothetical protein A6A03_08015 [Chloroflexus islandicus]|uniref:Uncharacterized protein n=1 Tax=Chloroflexus islandicus TaxID=1707952 RepID=A0A178MK58_9CHLR|nr:hypothetical protein [Chloroflexus islandicus]OAN48517.1 hypothetical protein A6A03_08015 [Chloroflexus islandicus]
MSVSIVEKVYRYPWRRRWWLATLGNLLVIASLVIAVYQLLRGVVAASEPLALWLRRTPWLRPLYDGLSPLPRDLSLWFPEALGVLVWAAVGLLVALLLLNALPALRVSTRGLLVEFAGGWLPVAWEDVQQIHVTGDEAGQRFVLLVIPAKSAKRLTGWHRVYGLLYGTTIRPAFLVSSSIDEFDHLLNTILHENNRAIRSVEGAQPVVVDEQRRSPLFGLFLRGATAAPPAANAVLPPTTAPEVTATLPAWSLIRIAHLSVMALVLIFGLLHYRSYWDRALTLMLPELRSNPALLWVSQDPVYRAIFNAYQGASAPFFGFTGRPDLPAPAWLLIAAHLLLALVIALAFALLIAIPSSVIAGQNGMIVRFLPRPLPFARTLPWASISAFQMIDLGFGRSIAFVQSPALPWLSRLCGLVVTGKWTPGAILIGTMKNWPALIEQCEERLSHLPPINDTPRFQPAAFMPNLQLIGQPVATIAALKAELTATGATTTDLLWRAGRAMLVVSLPLGLMFAIPALIDGDRWPDLGIILGGLGFWLAGLLEWPLVVLISLIIHGALDNDQEQAHIFTFYPLVQMPRLLPLLLALICLIVNLPWLAAILWLASLAIAYWVTAALWVDVYEWEGAQVILGGLLPAIWQLFVMVAFWTLR